MFIQIFLITFAVFCCFVLVMVFCRRRVARTRHGLSGMCHSSGGAMCSSCAGKLKEVESCKEDAQE